MGERLTARLALPFQPIALHPPVYFLLKETKRHLRKEHQRPHLNNAYWLASASSFNQAKRIFLLITFIILSICFEEIICIEPCLEVGSSETYDSDATLKVEAIFWETLMLWQNATALRIGSGSDSLMIPSFHKICLDRALILPINFEASSVVISLSPSEIIFCTAVGISFWLRVRIITL